MRYAIFSDIHANWEALETAVSHAKRLAADRYAVLGDTVGYGADPNACFEWVLKNASVHILGNHEKAVVDPRLRDWFNPVAREAIEWTAKVMDKKLKKEIDGLAYLKIEKSFSFAHGSLHEPESFHYLLTYDDALPSFEKLETPICFIGHTHVPACFSEKACSASYLNAGTLELSPHGRYLLNPGSVGQPRDQNPRLSFGIWDDANYSFEICRLDYDNRKAAGKIWKAGLPRYLGDRLL